VKLNDELNDREILEC